VSGRWKGRIEATDIVIAGEVEGDVLAHGKLEVAAAARISGNLTGRSVAIAEGAVIEGGVNVQGDMPLITFTEKRQSD
jgi:cytoskeletal protein CcmA (bactofilin family)